MRIARPNIQHRHNARFPSSTHYIIAIVIKCLAVNMAMRIDK
jgi:hypothetical protein